MSYLTGGPLNVRVRIAFGASIAADPATWAWTDVTAWWHTPDDVTIGWGRSSGAEQPEHSTLSLTLKNTDGRFTSYDARSPYWPHVRKWTPIQFDVDLGDGAGWRNRFSGFVRRWPLTWPGASPLMALARIEAVGVLGRLGRGKPPARSPMRRTIAASALAYWPMEDGDSASIAGSAIPGHEPLTVTGGPVAFADVNELVLAGNLRYGTDRIADLAGGPVLSAPVPADVTAATAAGWSAMAATQIRDLNATVGDVVLVEVETAGGTYSKWQLAATKSSGTFRTRVVAYTPAGTPTLVIDQGGVTNSFTLANFSVWQSSPGVISVGLNWFGSSYSSTATVGGTLAGVVRVSINTTWATSSVPLPVGHVAVWAGAPFPIDEGVVDGYDEFPGSRSGARVGFFHEVAHERLARLCAEDGITSTMPVVASDAATRMGTQPTGARLELYQQCEAADVGLIYEHGFGLGYLPRAARYNPPVALTIDAAAGQLGMPFEPVDDDQMLRNRWTVERIDGSSAVAEDAESIDVQGEIEGSASVNLSGDAPLPDHASWRLHLSTVQEPRYPALSINLAAHPELAAAWCDCQPGSRVQVLNPPAQNVPGVVDQLVVGASEVYRGRRSWRATLNVVPASRWQVAEVDGEQRIAADASTLASPLAASGMTLSLTSTAAAGPWTTDPQDFPLDIRVGGERITLSAITGTGLTQTATIVARGVNGVLRDWDAGTEVDVWQPAIAAL